MYSICTKAMPVWPQHSIIPVSGSAEWTQLLVPKCWRGGGLQINHHNHPRGICVLSSSRQKIENETEATAKSSLVVYKSQKQKMPGTSPNPYGGWGYYRCTPQKNFRSHILVIGEIWLPSLSPVLWFRYCIIFPLLSLATATAKNNLALSPALVETYSRLLVYTEIESLGIKGFVSQVLPKISSYQVWKVDQCFMLGIHYWSIRCKESNKSYLRHFIICIT